MPMSSVTATVMSARVPSMFMLISAMSNSTGGPLTHTREIFSPVNTSLEIAERETSECGAAVSSLNRASTA